MNNYAGIDIGGTKMLMLAEHEGKYTEKTVPTGIDAAPEYLRSAISGFLNGLPFEPSGIGIAIPGLVKNNDSVVISNVVPRLGGIKSEYFDFRGKRAVFINDVRAAAVEETSHYPDGDTVLVIMCGTGIAVSAKTNGKIINGAKGWAGELGSSVIIKDGEARTLDSLSSGAAILKKAGTDLNNFLNLVENNDERAISIIKEAGFCFGVAISTLINIFNPDVIVVGGSTSTYKGYMKEAVKAAEKFSLKAPFESCRITSPHDIKRIAALGAGRFAYLSDSK